MIDAIAIDGADLPPDVVDLLNQVTEIQQTQTSFSLTVKELGTLGQAVSGLKGAVTRGLRSAPNDEAVQSLVELLTEATGLQQRIESSIHDAFVSALGPDYAKSSAARQLNQLIDGRAAQAQEQAAAANTVARVSGDAAYL